MTEAILSLALDGDDTPSDPEVLLRPAPRHEDEYQPLPIHLLAANPRVTLVALQRLLEYDTGKLSAQIVDQPLQEYFWYPQ